MQEKNPEVKNEYVEMGRHAALGAVLYRIARYEKGKFRSSGYWRRKDRIQLLKSLEMMERLICLLSQEGEIADRDIADIIDFIKINKKMFGDIKKEYLKAWKIKLIDNVVVDDECIRELMLDIIYKIRYNIQNRPRKYKEQVWYLLHGLHNLPRVYMSNTEETLFPPLPLRITVDESLKCNCELENSYNRHINADANGCACKTPPLSATIKNK